MINLNSTTTDQVTAKLPPEGQGVKRPSYQVIQSPEEDHAVTIRTGVASLVPPTGPEQIYKTGSKCHHDNDKSKMTRRLDKAFVPGAYDVICARGGEAKNHVGNLNFRKRVALSAESYSKAPSKIFKSLIVTEIVEWIREQSPDGGFVKRLDGIWYEVNEDMAREKVGQGLREMNHSKYKSSMKAKRMRWKQEQQQLQAPRGHSDTMLRHMLHQHQETVEEKWRALDSQGSPDAQMLSLFTEQNKNLLQSLKSDDQVQEQINMDLG